MEKKRIMELRCPAIIESETENGVLVELIGQKLLTEIVVNKECLHPMSDGIDEDPNGAEHRDFGEYSRICFEKDVEEFGRDIVNHRIDKALKKLKHLHNLETALSFGDLCDKIKVLHAKKNADYGNAFSDMFSKFGIDYSLMHIEEKFRRIESLSKNDNQVKGESMKDSLIDLACYALMTVAELDEKKE